MRNLHKDNNYSPILFTAIKEGKKKDKEIGNGLIKIGQIIQNW